MDDGMRKRKRDAPARAFVFTLNNPTEAASAPKGLDQVFADQDASVRYAIYQGERGENGTPHLQGYVEFTRPVRLSHCRILLPTAHWEPRLGTREQAIAYSSKEATREHGPYEFGERGSGGQGKRSDLAVVKEKIDSGATEREIADEHFSQWCRNYRAFERYRRITGEQRDWPVVVEVFYGRPGTGKSRAALAENPGSYWKPRDKWWDGYEGQAVVVLDEYYGWLTWDTVLKICDRYPLLVETKGGYINFLARKVVITTNRDHRRWYAKTFPIEALERRVTKWSWFLSGGDSVTRIDYTTAVEFNQAISQ